jgi:hypothetical protein
MAYSVRMFRLTRGEQLLVAALGLALLLGAVVKHVRSTVVQQQQVESR